MALCVALITYMAIGAPRIGQLLGIDHQHTAEQRLSRGRVYYARLLENEEKECSVLMFDEPEKNVQDEVE